MGWHNMKECLLPEFEIFFFSFFKVTEELKSDDITLEEVEKEYRDYYNQ